MAITFSQQGELNITLAEPLKLRGLIHIWRDFSGLELKKYNLYNIFTFSYSIYVIEYDCNYKFTDLSYDSQDFVALIFQNWL